MLVRLFLLSGLLPLAAAAQSFAPPTTYSVGLSGSNPRGLAVADVNQDGYVDALTANYTDEAAAVLLGGPGGTFGPAVAYPTGAGHPPYDLVAADFNRDGSPDLATANYLGRTVGVLLNQSRGTFAAPVQYALGATQYPEALAAPDLNGDQYPDLVVASLGSGGVSVLLNQGNGTFGPATTYPVATGTLNVCLVVGDLNQDGRPDVAVASYVNTACTVNVLLSQPGGSGALAVAGTYSLGAGRQPYGLALGDVTRDGLPDLVVGDLGGDQVLVLRGQGAGQLLLPAVAYPTGAGSQPFGITLADANGDGFPDVLTANIGTNSVGLLLSQATGQLGAARAYASGARGEPVRVAQVDANHDGLPDLLVANSANGTLGVLLGTSPLAARGAAGPAQASLFPNPATSAATLRVTGLPAAARELQVALHDPTGRLVRQLALPVRQGTASGELPAAGLPAGSYLVRLLGVAAGRADECPPLRLLVLP